MLVLVFISIISVLWLWSRRNRNKDEPPLAHGSKILIGHALLYAGDSIKLWKTVKNFAKEALERGGVIKTTIGPRTLYILTNPDDCLTVSNACLEKDPIYDFSKPWVGDGLITSPPLLWKVQRKLLSPAFNQQVLDNFVNAFNKKSRDLVEDLKEKVGKGLFDHWKYAQHNALETVCLTMMGVDFKENSVDKSQYFSSLATVLNTLITRFQTFWLHNNFLFSLSSLKRKQDKNIKILHEMTYSILRQRKEYLANINKNNEEIKGPRFKPFIELLLELSRDTNVFTDREIREHVDTVIVAGFDAVAYIVMFCMLTVGSHPQVQEKIHQELKTIFGDEDRDVTKQDLSQLVYLEAVVKETLRLCPSVPVIGRYLDKDVKLRNCTLYKGNSAFIIVYGIHRHSSWGSDAEEFKPDRWLNGSTLPDSYHAFSTFGIGRRNCLGQNYSMITLKITLAHIFRNYITHGDVTKLQMKLDVTLKPFSGHYISIEKRN